MEKGGRASYEWQRRIVRRLGAVRAVALFTLVSTVVSLAITAVAMTLDGIEDPFLGYIIAIIVPVVLTPPITGMQFALIERLDEAELALHRLARTDELTGLPNRRALIEAGEDVLSRSRRRGSDVALLFVDVDHFKRINDTHGHIVGDLVLRHLARRIAGGLRETDLLCRFGGEEFAALLPDTDEQSAAEIAERLRRTTAASPIMARQSEGPAIPVTLSLGLTAAEAESAGDIHRLIDVADRAVYAAKEAGRDTVAMRSAV